LNRITTDNKTGAVCLSLTAGANRNTHVYEDVTVVPGKAYVLTFWTRDLSVENVNAVHTGGDNSLTRLTAAAANFLDDKVKVGQTLNNITDGSTGKIKSVIDKNNLEVERLTGGTDNDFDNGDTCQIEIGSYPGRYQIYNNSGATNIVTLRATTGRGSNRWHRIRRIFYAPAGCTSVRIYLYCVDNNTRQVYFDAVSLREYNATLGQHASYVPAYEEDGQSCWTVIKELLGLGDWENRQYNFGIYADREVRFELTPEYVDYFFTPMGADQRYYDRGGAVVSEWSIQPGKWMALSGFLIAEPIDLNRYTDPRVTFIDEVRFSLDLGVTINTSRMNKFKYLLAKAGLKTEEG
jgi:hypothetical protein